MLRLKIKKLNPEAKLPIYAHPDDAAMDLYAVSDTKIEPDERTSIPLGIAMEIPQGYVGLIWDKSGISHRHGIKTVGGVIDAGYRGEIAVGVINLSDTPYTFEKGHKVAQMIIQKKEDVTIEESDELAESGRGEGGFGSTGK